jgi:hypothetical protein
VTERIIVSTARTQASKSRQSPVGVNDLRIQRLTNGFVLQNFHTQAEANTVLFRNMYVGTSKLKPYKLAGATHTHTTA